MLNRIRRENEDGFTLIELMVVVLIISILIAIAIPTFLGARENAEDRGAQSNLRNSVTTAKTYYADEGQWVNGTTPDEAGLAALFEAIEPSLDFGVTESTDASPANYVFYDATDQQVTFGTYSNSGSCFYMREIATGTGAGTFFANVDATAAGACATPADTAFDRDQSVGW